MIYFFLDHCCPLNMFRNTIKNRCYVILILFAFCLSSATLGGYLLHGHEIHINHHGAHIHHSSEDRGLGESSHRDVSIILHHEYLAVNSSSIKTHFTPTSCLHSNPSLNYYDLFNTPSRITHYTSINKRCSHNLYQLKSSYLI